MNNLHFNKNIDSGMLSALKGLAAPHSVEVSPQQFVHKQTLVDFGEIRSRIEIACDEFELQEKPMSLMLIAVDDMDKLIENYGEYTANHVRDFVAASLFNTSKEVYGARNHFTVGEYVQGRLLMLLPEMVGATALEFADALRKGVCATEFNWQSEQLRITVSIGLVHKPGHNGNHDMLILQADHACSEVMKAGGNRVSLARAACRLRIVTE
jgi:diguanylate cyclase (GGDEF)-like protein